MRLIRDSKKRLVVMNLLAAATSPFGLGKLGLVLLDPVMVWNRHRPNDYGT